MSTDSQVLEFYLWDKLCIKHIFNNPLARKPAIPKILPEKSDNFQELFLVGQASY